MDDIDGFYAVYLTGAGGSGIVMLVLRAGIIAGADLGGAKYNGSYELHGSQIQLTVEVTFPPEISLVFGGKVGAQEEPYKIDHVLPLDFARQDYLLIRGPKGPVNAKFVKLRNLDD